MRGKTREKKKKEGENVETETQRSKRQPKHTHSVRSGRKEEVRKPKFGIRKLKGCHLGL